MAILIRPEGTMHPTHVDGWNVTGGPQWNQKRTAVEVLTEPPEVGQILMGSMVALPMARGP